MTSTITLFWLGSSTVTLSKPPSNVTAYPASGGEPEKRQWDRERVVAEAEQNLAGAREAKQFGSANGALELIGRVTGLLNEKQQHQTVAVTKITVITTTDAAIPRAEITEGTGPAHPRDSPFGPGSPVRRQRLCPDAGESPMVKQQYDQIAQQYEDAEKTIEGIHVVRPTFLKLCGVHACDRSVLDLACGSGIYSRVLKEAGAKRVVGIDISEEQIKIARRKEMNNPLGIGYIVGDVATYD